MNGRYILSLLAISSVAFARIFGQAEFGSWNNASWNAYVPIVIDLSQFAGDLVTINCDFATANPSAVNPAPISWATGAWLQSSPRGIKVTCTLTDHDSGQTVTFSFTVLSDGTVATTSGLTTNDPISTATGELFTTPPPDIFLGGPLPLEFQRYYASLVNSDGLNSRIGNNWTHNFEWALKITGPFVQVISPQTKVVTFQQSGSGYQLVVGEKYPYQLIAGANNTYQFLDPSTNLIYTFSGTGNVLGLASIRDRNNNTLTVSQPSAGVFQIGDGMGRTLTLNFDPTSSNVSKVTDQTGRFTSYAYSGGNLTQFIDANGKSETLAYTTAGSMNGLMTSATMPLGNKPLSQTFNTFGQVATQTDSLGNTTNISYDPTTGTTLAVNPLGVTTKQTSRGFVDFASFVDPDQQTISAGYDSKDHRNLVTDRFGDKTSRTYDVSGQVATETNASGYVTTYTWTPQTAGGFTFYNLTSVATSDGSTTAFTYDANGNRLTSTDSSGKVTKFAYNSKGQLTSTTDPAGHVTSNAYNADGTLASSTDAAGNVTTYTYDAAKRVTQVKFADGTTRSATYDNRDNILKETDERGKVTTVTYNDNNNVSTMTDPLGKSIAVAYDSNDNIVKLTDRTGNSAGFTYNALGFTQTVTTAAGEATNYSYDTHNRLQAIADSSGKGPSFTYDKEDVPAAITDALSRKTSFTTDKLGYLLQTTWPLGENSVIARNSREGVISSIDASGIKTSFGFDSVNRLSTTTIGGLTAGISRDASGALTGIMDPNGNMWNFNLNSAGRIGARTDPLNRPTAYTYDARNRFSTVTTPVGNVAFTYDPAGNLTNRKYSDGTNSSYTYDDDGRLTGATGVTLSVDANGRLTNSNGIAINRDKDGRIASITYASGKTVTYTYNSQGLLIGISDWVNGSTAFAYDAALELTSMTRPNKLATRYGYDLDGRMTSIQEDANSLAIAVQRDPAGKILSENYTPAPSITLPPSGTQAFTFDAADEVSSYTYDGMGRVTKDSLRNYTWNLASEMTARSGADGSASATYDAFGLRTSLTSGGQPQNFIWNYATGLPTIATVQKGGADQQYLVYTPSGLLLYAINASSNARTYFHFDAHGSTTMLSNDAGTVTDTYLIGPYGESVVQSGSTNNPFTWMGQFGVMQEGSTGLFYIRARYYDSITARFLSPDSQVSTQPLQVNPYQFALLNPISNTDATGAEPQSDENFFRQLAYSLADAAEPGSFYNYFGQRGRDILNSGGFNSDGRNQTAFWDPVPATPNPVAQRSSDPTDFLNLPHGSEQGGGLSGYKTMKISSCSPISVGASAIRSYRTGGSIIDPTPTTYSVPNPARLWFRDAFIQFAGFQQGRSWNGESGLPEGASAWRGSGR